MIYDCWLGHKESNKQNRQKLREQWQNRGRKAQSVKCLTADACLTADPGVASLIPAPSHTLVEMNHVRISMIILLPSADSFKKVCC